MAGLMTVSYTHLDVYKRQVMNKAVGLVGLVRGLLVVVERKHCSFRSPAEWCPNVGRLSCTVFCRMQPPSL